MSGPDVQPLGPLTPGLRDRLLALNNAHAAELSWLDADRLAMLARQAFWAARVGDMDGAARAGDVDGFVLALDHTADYDSPNYRWFRNRFGGFAYVDRIVIAPAARGRGLARLLYDGVFAAAAAAGHDAVMAEVNHEPPNPASDALHATLGFQEVGRASHPAGPRAEARTVRYLMRSLT